MKSLLFLVMGSWLFVSPVLAQSPTASEIREAVQQKVQEELSAIKQSVAKKGFVGSITGKTESTFSLTNLKNESRSIVIAPDATIRLDGGVEGTESDLKTNDFILVMGDVDSQNKMTAKRLLVLKPPTADRRQVMFGTIKQLATNSITLENAKQETWTIRTSSSTVFSKTVDGKSATSRYADLEVGSKIALVGTPPATGQNTLTGSAIHIHSETQ